MFYGDAEAGGRPIAASETAPADENRLSPALATLLLASENSRVRYADTASARARAISLREHLAACNEIGRLLTTHILE